MLRVLKTEELSKGLNSYEKVTAGNRTPDRALNVLILYQSEHNDRQGQSGVWLNLTVPSLQHKRYGP